MTATTLAASGAQSPLWYLTRGAGLVTLLLLTATVVVGIVDVRRWHARGWPRFVVDALHRDLALLTVAMLAVHVLTTVLDHYVHISLVDAVVPFAGSYKPLWVGIGALACDLLLALVVTSLLRRQIGPRVWHAVHWLAYACWPVAMLHGIGIGTDVNGGWALVLVGACAVAVAAALAVRAGSPPTPAGPSPGASGGGAHPPRAPRRTLDPHPRRLGGRA